MEKKKRFYFLPDQGGTSHISSIQNRVRGKSRGNRNTSYIANLAKKRRKNESDGNTTSKKAHLRGKISNASRGEDWSEGKERRSKSL